jgi:alkanesulfonate monooxygenase SsuD/methylene tetrahydromethanopterin reductase-like flavin-dependent oxidoreductase (luciferase family)
MARMKVGVGIDPRLGLSRAQQRTLVQESARIGYDSLWTPAGVTARSIFQTCREWWEATTEVAGEGLRVGTSVIPFPGWTVPTLAAESATLNDITGGKFNLGIGLGAYPSEAVRRQLGLPLIPLVAFSRDYVRTLRDLFAGKTVDYDGKGVRLHGVQLTFSAPPVPVYLAAMGPQMLRLSGECADGVTPNWCSAEQVAWMRQYVAEGARKAGRDPSEVPFALYIRVCIDEDEDAARRTFASNMLGYAMARPGMPKDVGYRAHFGRMGFEDVLTELEARRDAGARLDDLVDLVPPELMKRVGYFGRPAGAAEAMKCLAEGLDEAMVRLITVRPGDLDACLTAVRACQPTAWATR